MASNRVKPNLNWPNIGKPGVQRCFCNIAPSVAKVLLPLIFSNRHNLGTKTDKQKSTKCIRKIFALSIDSIECLFIVSLPVFKLKRFETYERKHNNLATYSTFRFFFYCYSLVLKSLLFFLSSLFLLWWTVKDSANLLNSRNTTKLFRVNE